MRLVVDTGIFSASLSRRRRARFGTHVQRMAGQQVFLAAVTISELRYGALHDRIHANDLWIAASAIHIAAPLLTADGVFDSTPGLTLHQ